MTPGLTPMTKKELSGEGKRHYIRRISTEHNNSQFRMKESMR